MTGIPLVITGPLAPPRVLAASEIRSIRMLRAWTWFGGWRGPWRLAPDRRWVRAFWVIQRDGRAPRPYVWEGPVAG